MSGKGTLYQGVQRKAQSMVQGKHGNACLHSASFAYKGRLTRHAEGWEKGIFKQDLYRNEMIG